MINRFDWEAGQLQSYDSNGDEEGDVNNNTSKYASSNPIALDNSNIIATVTTQRGATIWVVQPSSPAATKEIASPYRIYEQCSICLTTVGTNTAELGALGTKTCHCLAIL